MRDKYNNRMSQIIKVFFVPLGKNATTTARDEISREFSLQQRKQCYTEKSDIFSIDKTCIVINW